jgi:ribosomal protein L11 methylase PrmA
VDALRGAGAHEVLAEGGRVSARFIHPPDALHDALNARVLARFAAFLPGYEPDPRWSRFDVECWLARRPPERIPLPGGGVLHLAPGVGFGTGDHPTTRRCLEELPGLVRPGLPVLDLGAGSGVLGLAASALGASPVVAVELDPAACAEAEGNARSNGLELTVVCHRVTPEDPGVLLGGLPFGDASWSGIAANLEAPVLRPLLPVIAEALAPDGWCLASGLLAGEAREVLAGAGPLRALRAHDDGGWVTLVVPASPVGGLPDPGGRVRGEDRLLRLSPSR